MERVYPDHNLHRLPQAGQPSASDPHPFMTLRDIVTMMRKGWLMIAGTALLCLMLALAYGVTRDRYYDASAEIYVDPRGLQVVERDVTRAAETSDAGIAFVESQMRVMTSDSVLAKVVQSERLYLDREFVGSEGGLLSSLASLVFGQGNAIAPEARALGELRSAVTTTRNKLGYVVNLHVRTKDADKSAQLANVIAETYLANEIDNRSGLARRASGELNQRLDELRAEVTEAENAVETYKLDNNILGINGGLANEQELAQFNILLAQANRELANAQSRRDQSRRAAQTGDVQSLPEAVASNNIALLRSQYQQALDQQAILSEKMLSRHPQMRALAAQVESARAAITAEIGRILQAAEADYERALSNRQQLEAQYEALRGQSFRTNDAMVRLRELEREAEAKRNVYQAYMVRAKELGEQEELDTNLARIISFAMPPERAVGAGTSLVLAFGLLVGLLGGSALALLMGVLTGSAPARKPQDKAPRRPQPAFRAA
ncbi:GumC family protein [Aquamicrobium sp. LC103]|uniref:GumC family protein n=1 Tax=Aquamicrobium sp. LC103 TaxID=1120658 RepID=UPI000AED732C|nr:GumC family protein [Aquamicrobium sp. LC103]TKT77464.1 hypothetical protein XW59_013410 [Aquamicrobium sp. LC103]